MGPFGAMGLRAVGQSLNLVRNLTCVGCNMLLGNSVKGRFRRFIEAIIDDRIERQVPGLVDTAISKRVPVMIKERADLLKSELLRLERESAEIRYYLDKTHNDLKAGLTSYVDERLAAVDANILNALEVSAQSTLELRHSIGTGYGDLKATLTDYVEERLANAMTIVNANIANTLGNAPEPSAQILQTMERLSHRGAELTALIEAQQKVIETVNSSLLTLMQEQSKNLLEIEASNSINLLNKIEECKNTILADMVRQRLAVPFNPDAGAPVEKPKVVNPITVSEAFARLENLAPLNWPSYLKCLDTGTESYTDLPETSCSTENHPESMLFRAFVKPYLRGYVLDIGCGPQPVPSYLMDYPVDRIVGIDPISEPEDHPFTFVPGVGEFLPFKDQSFDVVLSGTTLDHYYLLDRGLEEAFRVLKPGGHYVAWISEFAGAPAYNPYSSPMKPYDSEHMFHIDREWFLPLMSRIGFRKVEVLHFTLPFNYLFMSFERPA